MDYQLNLTVHGLMHPDYFQGTAGVQLNIYITDKTTIKEVIDLLKEEINVHWSHIEYTLFDANEKEIPYNIEEKITEMFQEIEQVTNLKDVFSANAPTVEEFESEEEIAPFIFSITIEFLD